MAHSSTWNSAACTAATAYRNHFFCLYWQDKAPAYIVKFRQASNPYKRVLAAAKLAYASKQKKLSLPRNLALVTFDELLIVFSTNINLLYLLYLMDLRCCL